LRADDATRRVDEAAKTIQDLNNELTNLKKKFEDADASKADTTVLEQRHKEELAVRLPASFSKLNCNLAFCGILTKNCRQQRRN
jgi:hypothetical protein